MTAYWRLVLTDNLLKCLLLHACVHRRCYVSACEPSCLRREIKGRHHSTVTPIQPFSLHSSPSTPLAFVAANRYSYNGRECVPAPDKYTM